MTVLRTKKTNPIRTQFITAKRSEAGFITPKVGEPNFHSTKTDLVATFGHDVYSMAKYMGEI